MNCGSSGAGLGPLSFAVATTVLALVLLASTAVAQSDATAQFVPGEFIVKYDDHAVRALIIEIPELTQYSEEEVKTALTQTLGAEKLEHLELVNAEKIATTTTDELDIEAAVDLLDADLVEYIEPNYVYGVNVVPNDPSFGSLWGLHQSNDIDIDAPEAWDIVTGNESEPIVVGVVDTGIDYNHVDLSANMWRNTAEYGGSPGVDDDGNGYVDDIYGWNGVSNNGNPMDDQASTYHGTHCAGTIGAVSNNGIGITGVAWNVKLMALKFLGSNGSGATSDAIEVINYAITMRERGVNLRVLSNSWGGGGYSQALFEAVQAANNVGIIFIAAAGNNNSNNDSSPAYPANYTNPNVISVAAVSSNGSRASFSNYGATTVDLAAPGVSIYSTKRGNAYQSLNGTSMATPHVSGVAALVLSRYPQYNPSQLKAQLLDTVQPVAALNGLMLKPGIVNARAAVANPSNMPPTLQAIANVSVSPRVRVKQVPISATDQDSNDLTYTAEILFEQHLVNAAALDQQYNFTSHPSQYNNYWGYGEKRIVTGSGAIFAIFSDGLVYQLVGNYLQGVGSLDTRYYTNPNLLVSAHPLNGSQFASLQFNPDHSILTVTTASGFEGSFRVQVTVSDGERSDARAFTVNVVNNAPTIAALPDLEVSPNQIPLTVALSIEDPDDDPLTVNATALTVEQLAHELDNELQLYHTGNSHLNFLGGNETYVRSAANTKWYFITPDGGLYEQKSTLALSPKVAQLDSRYHANSTLLYEAPSPSGPTVTATVTNQLLTVTPPPTFEGSLTVTVRASDASETSVQRFTVVIVNHAPVLQPIADQFTSPSAGALEVALSASDSDGDSLSYTAGTVTVEQLAYELDQELQLYHTGNSYFNFLGGNETYVRSATNTKWYFITPTGGVYEQKSSLALSTKIAQLDSRYHANSALLYSAPAPQAGTSPAAVTIVDGKVRIQPTSGFTGTFLVRVTVSDGSRTAGQLFSVTVENRPPTLADIANVQIAPQNGSRTVTLAGSDPDGDALTYSASIVTVEQVAYELDQSLQLYHTGNSYYNFLGGNETYVRSATTTKWYFITPTGGIYEQGSSIAASVKVAQLDARYHANSALLYNAPAPEGSQAPATLTVVGTNLTIALKPDFLGQFVIRVSVSDGTVSTSKTFSVTVANNAPILQPVGNKHVSPQQGSLSFNLQATDADNDVLTYTATVQTVEAVAYQLDQDLQLYHTGNSYFNFLGGQETYVRSGSNSKWYFITPDGGVFEQRSSIAASVKVAQLDSRYHANSALLHAAPQPQGAEGIASASTGGSTVTLTPASGFTGIFYLRIAVSDGIATDTEIIQVTVANRPPTLSPIADRAIARANALQVTLSGSDPDGDTLSYSATAMTVHHIAYELDSELQLYFTGNSYFNFLGGNETYVRSAANTKWYFITPAGGLYEQRSTLAASVKVAQLDANFYANPSALYNAPLPADTTPPAATTLVGQSLTVVPADDFVGNFYVSASVTDGTTVARQRFLVTVNNQAPVIAPIQDLSVPLSAGSAQASVVATDADGDQLQYSAKITTVEMTAYALDQELKLYHTGNSWFNFFGVSETYVRSAVNSKWYFITPNGRVYRQGQNFAQSTLVATLEPRYHANPSLLFAAPAPTANVPATFSFTGNILTISLATAQPTAFKVQVTVSDGAESAVESFDVTVTESQTTGIDSDGDGVDDEQEVSDGTDPYDSGSFLPNISSPVYTVWNSFLRMTNILELTNPTPTDTTARVTLYGIDGSIAAQRTVNIPAEDQFDLIVNELDGFVENSYGILKIEFDGFIDGRVSYYRPTPSGTEFEFAFGVALANASKGTTAVGFNTFQPSFDATEQEHEVANWLSIINLAREEKIYTVLTYDQNGTLLQSRQVTVSGLGRSDIDGGHGIAGRNVVGMHKIVPSDASAQYIAQLIRYGGNAAQGIAPSAYRFAFPLVARAGNGRQQLLPISRQFGESNWVELVNTLEIAVPCELTFWSNDGVALRNEQIELAPHAQQHFDASALLEAGQSGMVSVNPQVPNSIVTQSMFYFRDSNGRIEAMYGSQAREAAIGKLAGSFNLYLGMQNWLRVANPSSNPITIRIAVNNPTGTIEQSVTLSGHASKTIAIHGTEFQTLADTYGRVVLSSTGNAGLLAELLRLRTVGTIVDFAAPTEVR
ncbi:MAG: S8 family serine peptidase [Bdellovibrionales bacterium]|nr:S8 family serine peptidase [Bdellovibrionales bacterium]